MAKKPKNNNKYQMSKGYLKGQPRRRGIPLIYSEVKEKLNLMLTPTAKEIILNAAKLQGVSRSELVERWARENLVKNKPELPVKEDG
jgi:hypothetical protein